MMSKVLCIALLVCTIVHAVPTHDFLKPNLDNIIDKVGDAAHAVLADNTQSLRNKLDSAIETSGSLYDASIQSMNTKMALARLPIRFMALFLGKSKKPQLHVAEQEGNAPLIPPQAEEIATHKPEAPVTKE